MEKLERKVRRERRESAAGPSSQTQLKQLLPTSRHDHMDPAEDPDLADQFLRQNFDPPANLPVMREKAQLFCNQVPEHIPIVLISVSLLSVTDR